MRDRVLLVRRTPFGESSLVVQGLARTHGRVHLLAKGAHRATSRFAHTLDLLDTLQLEWHAKPDQELGTLAAGELAVRRRRISGATDAWRAATTTLELVDIAARPGEPDPRLFDLASLTLDRLDAGAPPELTLTVFELLYLTHVGLAPALDGCAACGRDAAEVQPGRAAFSAGAGGRLCPAHAAEARASGRRVGTLPTEVLAAAARFGATPFPALVASAPAPALIARVRDFIGRFLDYHLAARPKSHRALLDAPSPDRPTSTAP
ncbi:MAG: DNA repair protein RecO [Planctomycetota bacterium]